MIDVYFWPTGNGKKVTIMLEECGLPYNVIPVNINKGAQVGGLGPMAGQAHHFLSYSPQKIEYAIHRFRTEVTRFETVGTRPAVQRGRRWARTSPISPRRCPMRTASDSSISAMKT